MSPEYDKATWVCEKCGAGGTVRHCDELPVLEARLASAHHQQSPECGDDFGISYVVWNVPEKVTEG
jgi:hypothetical protein